MSNTLDDKKELLDALYGMYMQYCSGKWGHHFMNAGELASEILEEEGYIQVDNIGAVIKDNYEYGYNLKEKQDDQKG